MFVNLCPVPSVTQLLHCRPEKPVSVLPAEVDETPIPTSVKMALLRDGKPVTTVSLGEELELRWWFTATGVGEKQSKFNKTGVKKEKTIANDPPHKGKLGFFVDSCVAEVRLDG